jgi:hypothetical protein
MKLAWIDFIQISDWLGIFPASLRRKLELVTLKGLLNFLSLKRGIGRKGLSRIIRFQKEKL